MNGELAQVTALVAHGNFFLDGGEADFSANSTFQFVSAVKFARYKSNQDSMGMNVAGSVSDWLTFLRSIKATRLWNIAFGWQRKDLPEHIAASFSGSVPMAIQADLPNGFELWYPQWKTGGHEKRPWLVEYRGLMFPNSYIRPVQKMGLLKAELRQAVSQAENFAKRPDVNADSWAAVFTKSLELLDSSAPAAPYHPDLLPVSGYSLEARQVLASAVQAYVFGGMGSWNDMGFTDPQTRQEYEKVTSEMYETVKRAIIMAANSYESLKPTTAPTNPQQTGGIFRGLQRFFKP